MANSLHHIARTRLTFGTNHCCSLGNTAQSLAKVLGSTHERYIKLVLVNMVYIVSRTQYLTLVDVVNLYCLKYLRLSKMADATLCHHGDTNRLLNTLDHLRVTHT